MRTMRLSSLEAHPGERALLDEGATHALCVAKDMAEYEASMEAEVGLAQGKVAFRQMPWSRTFLSATKVQSIVPLGVLADIGYCVHWES